MDNDKLSKYPRTDKFVCRQCAERFAKETTDELKHS